MPNQESVGTDGPGARAKRPTMQDVAGRVGVSRALVSLVFRNAPGASQETRDRVITAAAELGYRPDSAARVLARSRSRMLGVILTVRNPFHADLVEAIYSVAEQRGYDIVLSAKGSTRGEHKAIEALLGHRCEALILLGPDANVSLLADAVHYVPVVAVGRRMPKTGIDSVHTAEARGVRQAIDYLVELGHREIAHIDGGTGAGSAERRRGYRDAMRKHGLAEHIRVLPGDHTEESGARAAQVLLGEERLPTAMLAGNDQCAFGLLDAFARAGVRVPEEISVVGYDDNPMAQLSHIDLTTVRQDIQRMAEHAVSAAIGRVEDPTQPVRDVVLEPKLVVRGTTGSPRVRLGERQ